MSLCALSGSGTGPIYRLAGTPHAAFQQASFATHITEVVHSTENVARLQNAMRKRHLSRHGLACIWCTVAAGSRTPSHGFAPGRHVDASTRLSRIEYVITRVQLQSRSACRSLPCISISAKCTNAVLCPGVPCCVLQCRPCRGVPSGRPSDIRNAPSSVLLSRNRRSQPGRPTRLLRHRCNPGLAPPVTRTRHRRSSA